MKLPVDVGALRDRVVAWYTAYSPRDRRIILAVLALVGLSIVYVGVVEPILDYRKAAAEEIDAGHAKLERAMRLVGTKDALRAERDELKKRLAQVKTRLLPGGTATLGAAALQERANALASEKGITVQSTQVMKEEALEPFRKVGVRLSLSGEIGPLAELVSALEYGQQLAVPFIEVSRRGAVAGSKAPRTLSATVEVNGFVQGGTPGKTDGAEGEVAPAETAAETAPEGQAAGAPAGAPDAPSAETGPAAPAAPGAPEAPGAPTTAATSTIPPMTFPQMVVPTPTVRTTVPPPPAIGPSEPADEDPE